jgi:hypothetical protein
MVDEEAIRQALPVGCRNARLLLPVPNSPLVDESNA